MAKDSIHTGRAVSCLIALRRDVIVVTAIKDKRNFDAYWPQRKRAELSHPVRPVMWHTFTSKTKMKQFLKNEFSAVGACACYINWVK